MVPGGQKMETRYHFHTRPCSYVISFGVIDIYICITAQFMFGNAIKITQK